MKLVDLPDPEQAEPEVIPLEEEVVAPEVIPANEPISTDEAGETE
jgi:hypothetical protein